MKAHSRTYLEEDILQETLVTVGFKIRANCSRRDFVDPWNQLSGTQWVDAERYFITHRIGIGSDFYDASDWPLSPYSTGGGNPATLERVSHYGYEGIEMLNQYPQPPTVGYTQQILVKIFMNSKFQ